MKGGGPDFRGPPRRTGPGQHPEAVPEGLLETGRRLSRGRGQGDAETVPLHPEKQLQYPGDHRALPGSGPPGDDAEPPGKPHEGRHLLPVRVRTAVVRPRKKPLDSGPQCRGIQVFDPPVNPVQE